MTDESVKTGADAQAINNAEGAAPIQTPEQPGNPGISSGVQQRIDQMTARTKAAEEKTAAAETALEAERLKNKSEQEKAFDLYASEKLEQFRVTEHDPIITERDALKGAVEGVVETLKQQIPEDKRPDFSGLPLRDQLEAYSKFSAALETGPAAPAGVDSGGNPPSAPSGRKWKLSEIRANNSDQEWWRANREDILRAQKEGRVLLDQ